MCLPTRILKLLCIASLTGGATGCNIDGPENCQFAVVAGEPILCGWTLGGDFQLNSTLGGYIQLVQGSDTGTLTSKTACSTGGQTHCFGFAYRIDGVNLLNLSVSIKYGLNESLLWILSSSGGWNDASVPITTNHDFSVIFKAKKHCGQNAIQGSVRLDSIRYANATTNSCSFYPASASPTSVPPIPSSCNSTTPLPSTTQKTTISHDIVTGRIRTAISHETVTTTSISHESVTETAHVSTSTRAGTQFPTSADAKDDVAEPSNNAGIIVGGVLAGVVVVTVTLVVLVRQKRLCFENKQQETQSQDDDGYEIPLPRTDIGNNTDMASRRENEGARETVSGTDIGHSRDHALTQPSERVHLPIPTVSNNYDCLDFTNSEQDRRVYASFNDGPDRHGALSQPGLYESLGERRDSHIYGHTPETSLFRD